MSSIKRGSFLWYLSGLWYKDQVDPRGCPEQISLCRLFWRSVFWTLFVHPFCAFIALLVISFLILISLPVMIGSLILDGSIIYLWVGGPRKIDLFYNPAADWIVKKFRSNKDFILGAGKGLTVVNMVKEFVVANKQKICPIIKIED